MAVEEGGSFMSVANVCHGPKRLAHINAGHTHLVIQIHQWRGCEHCKCVSVRHTEGLWSCQPSLFVIILLFLIYIVCFAHFIMIQQFYQYLCKGTWDPFPFYIKKAVFSVLRNDTWCDESMNGRPKQVTIVSFWWCCCMKVCSINTESASESGDF